MFLAIPLQVEGLQDPGGGGEGSSNDKEFSLESTKKRDRYRECSAPPIFLGCSTLIYIFVMYDVICLSQEMGCSVPTGSSESSTPRAVFAARFGPGRSYTLRCLQHLL